jgi:nicotinamidase-related amidase
MEAPLKAIQFLVSAQRDFIGRISTPDSKPNELHVGAEAVAKLRGDGRGVDPFVDTTREILDGELASGERVQVVLDEDWHNANCPEFEVYGRHCVKGTDGASLIGELEDHRWEDNVHIIRANSINIASDPRYEQTLTKVCGSTPTDRVHVGLYGVWTNIKIEYLAVNLLTFPPHFPAANIGICEPLTATPNVAWHDGSIEKLRMMGFNVFDDVDGYLKWLGVRG